VYKRQNRDYEPYATARDSALENSLKSKGVDFFTFKDQVIFEAGEILTKEGEPYKVFTPYKNKWFEKFNQVGVSKHDSEANLKTLVPVRGREIPSLSQMNFKRTEIDLPPAEISDALISQYAARRDFPAEHGTSKLGVHLRFGTVSIRDLARRAHGLSDTWLSELIWREFYMMILAHYPRVIDQAFKPQYDRIPWINDETQFEKWCNGMTGYPLVDAGMRELNATGYMHNRVRMVVASFLTKHLLIDWRWGERYFASRLLDFELSSNNGGWQWAAGTGTDAQPYFRVFNPYSQQEKFDPKLKYVRRWVPEYGSPDYPEPIVSHKEARLRAIETYKLALSQN
jgi:deoxyribodipyrimidine photo-lyase